MAEFINWWSMIGAFAGIILMQARFEAGPRVAIPVILLCGPVMWIAFAVVFVAQKFGLLR